MSCLSVQVSLARSRASVRGWDRGPTTLHLTLERAGAGAGWGFSLAGGRDTTGSSGRQEPRLWASVASIRADSPASQVNIIARFVN